ncbi:hypothetical protein [Aquimarina muelleri]|uniref:Uncharacterized protein n=1 Tax=Aquimarina muelleri TaxID=279356 RepID=A0A918N3P9_9FLAO|nr:hypothetical protein [Aquimarina muelleri]MCX2761761.1 hypothetical protein [Aquimarina muelleri]GGX15987.1 hypothetical protein GCM10007384_16920 [Aquimarina muelleri]
MIEFFKLLSNREISIIIWTLLFFAILVFKSKGSLLNLWSVIKVIFVKKIIPFYIIIGLYLFIIINIFRELSIWEFSLYKDFIYWFLTTGLVLFFGVSDIKNYKDFTKIILTTTSLTTILEFIVGFYNFSLIWELILIPSLTFISILPVFADLKKDDPNTKIVANFLKNVLTIIGFGFLIYGIYKLIVDYADFFTLSNLKSFLLPPIFTLVFLPIIYYTVLYIKYEKVFENLRRYKFLTLDRKKKIRSSILRYAYINLNYIENANKIIIFRKRELQNETDIKSYLRKNVKLKQNA